MADGEGLVTQPAVHGTSADRQFTQHSTSSTSQLHQPSPSDDSYRDPSDDEDTVVVTMTEQLSTSRSEQVGGATGRIYVPRNSSWGQRDEPGRHVTFPLCVSAFSAPEYTVTSPECAPVRVCIHSFQSGCLQLTVRLMKFHKTWQISSYRPSLRNGKLVNENGFIIP